MLASPARAVLKIDLELRIRDSENPVSERPPMDRFWGVGGAWHAEPRDWSQQARSTGRFCVESALRPAATPRSQGTSRDRSAGPAGARGQVPCPPSPPGRTRSARVRPRPISLEIWGSGYGRAAPIPATAPAPGGVARGAAGPEPGPSAPPRSPPARLRGPPPNPSKMRPEALGRCTGAWGVGDGRGSTAPAC